MTLRIPIHVIVGVSLYSCCTEAKKRRDPQGFASSVLIAFIFLSVWSGDCRGSPLKITIAVYYVKSMGIKVMIQKFLLGTCCFHTSSAGQSSDICYSMFTLRAN